MSISKGMLQHLQDFNTLNGDSEEQKPLETHDQELQGGKDIQLLEIYVERSSSMTLGQRISWHLNLINKKLCLPCIPDEQEFFLKAVNVSYKRQQKDQHSVRVPLQLPQESLYCQDSNTVFYYSEYKILLLLDFSKSTSTVYPFQTKSYVDKLHESIEIFILNLWFKLNNKYGRQSSTKQRAHSSTKEPLDQLIETRRYKNQSRRKQFVAERRLRSVESRHDPYNSGHNYQANQSEQPYKNLNQDYQTGISQFVINEAFDENDDTTQPDQQQLPKFQKPQNQDEDQGLPPNEYNPTIYMSIVASGLPPSNNMRILVHNQKLDDNNRYEVLKSLHSRLMALEQLLADSFNMSSNECVQPSNSPSNEPIQEVKQEEYLQNHLQNAQKILNMMQTGAKSLLILFTDSTNSLMARGGGQSLDTAISKLHAADTKIITVDLGDENKVGNTFGYVNHEEDLKYLAYVTCGAHFNYSTLIKLAGIFTENYIGQNYDRKHPASLLLNFGLRNKSNENSQSLGNLCNNRLNNLAGIKAGKSSIFNLGSSLKPAKQHQDLSQNDQFHSQLNSLQKLMFARPCNYSLFLQFQEIQQLVAYQERLIFENRVSSDLIKRLRQEKNLAVNPSFSVSELLLNGRYVPIFRKEQLSEYRLESCSRASHICEYRSRMCFQFRNLTIVDHPSSKSTSSPLDRPGSKIRYQYWWSNQILILCSIEQMRSQENERQVHIRYKLVAQEEVIDQIKRDRKLLFSKGKNGTTQQQQMFLNNFGESSQLTLLEQLQDFLQEIQKCDQYFEFFEAIQSDIKRTFKVVHQRQETQQGKYLQKIGCQDEEATKIYLIQESQQTFKEAVQDDQFTHDLQLPAKKPSKIAQSEQEAVKILQRHRKNWTHLLKIPVSQWQQIFIYNRLDIVSQSSFEQAALNSNAGTDTMTLLEQINAQDLNIEKAITGEILKFTSFQISGDTFVQIFQDHRSSARQVNGFCLLKMQWAAHNIAVCHLGFYQVSPKLQKDFTQALKQCLTCFNQQVYEKQVASLLVLESRAFIKYNHHPQQSEHLPFEHCILKQKPGKSQSIYMNQVPFQIGDLCYNKQWLWKNDNSLTNKDFFETLVRQRLREGFIFVNRNQQSHTQEKFLFIKILKAYKQKKGKIGNLRNSTNIHNQEENDRFVRLGGSNRFSLTTDEHKYHFMDSSNETDVVLQYVMHIGKKVEHDNSQHHSTGQSQLGDVVLNQHAHMEFRTELLLEHESGFFFIEKHHHFSTNIGKNSTFSLEGLLQKDQENVNCLPDKNFFPRLCEYIFDVDKYLFNNICTYHTIIKNSILKMIDTSTLHMGTQQQQQESLIKSEVCYFKNIFTQEVEQALQSKKSRKRLRLEFQIKSKMQMLKRDWGEYLRNSYPELFPSIKQDADNKMKAKTHIHIDSYTDGVKLMDESSFQLQIQDFIDNSKAIGKEVLLIPDYIFNNRPENYKEIVSNFYDQILRIYEDFSDFKLKRSDEDLISAQTYKYNYYVKLVTKQILFVIKFPAKQEYMNSLINGKFEDGSIEVEYFRATKRMIRISKKLMKSPYLHLLNPNYHTNHEVRERAHTISDHHLSQNCSEMDGDELFDEEEEENINQIDQICDFLFYYEQDLREGSQQLQFEPHVQTIIDNFCSYLKTNFDIIYADTVLMNIPDDEIFLNTNQVGKNRRSRKSSSGSVDVENQPTLKISDHLKNDFQKIKKTMTKCRFKLDISFLCQMINEMLVKKKIYIDGRVENQRVFRDALDEVFSDIVTRNFRNFETDKEFFVFKKNYELDEHGNYPESKPQQFNDLQMKDQEKLSEPYLYNLEGTKDSYSDSEDGGGETKRNFKRSFSNLANPFQPKSCQLGQSSCKKLLFKVDLIVKNLTGDIVLEKKLEKLSEVFDEANQEIISQVCEDLSKKAQYIVEERRHDAKMIQENKEFLDSNQFLEYFINEQTLFLNNSNANFSTEFQDHKETQSAVEIYFSFYTIPQYVGIIKDQDIDYICNEQQDEILVNDDDHEDLIRVSKLNNLLPNNQQPTCLAQRLEFEDLTPFKENTWNLYKPFNKKQLVKSIPYYFKHSDKKAKDYRMYYYDEIQRKIIYGILRRSYALIAQGFIEYLSLITHQIDPLNVIILQKYMGAVLDNQRKELSFKIMDKLGNKTKQAMKYLTDELKQSKIINLTYVKMTQDKNNNHDELFFVKSQQHLKNFFLKHQIDYQQAQIPLNIIDEDNVLQMQEQILLKPYVTDLNELEIIENENKKHSQQPFEVPFWLIFRLVHKFDQSSGLNSVYLESAFHLPKYKNHIYLDESIVEKEMHRCIDMITKRANLILIMNQVEQSLIFPSNLVLNEYHQEDNTNGSPTHSNLSLATHQQTLNRLEQAKLRAANQMNETDQSVKILNLQKTLSSQQSSVGMSQHQKQTTSVTSKFKKRMGKFNLKDESTSDVSSKLTQELPVLPGFFAPQFKATQPYKNETHKVNKVFQYAFPLNHSEIRVEDGIKAIQQTLYNYQIEQRQDLFVLKKDSNIYLIKIFGQHSPNDSTGKQSMLQSFNQHQSHLQMSTISNQNYDLTQNLFTHGITTDDSGALHNKDNSNIASGILLGKVSSIGVQPSTINNQGQHNSIMMEVYSASACIKSHMVEVIMLIEKNLTKKIKEKLAINCVQHQGHLSKEDLNYIEGSDQKMIFAFPLQDQQVSDHYALMRFLKQNLTRLLIPIQLQQIMQMKPQKIQQIQDLHIDQTHQSVDPKTLGSFQANLKHLNQPEMNYDTLIPQTPRIFFKQEDFQLLYNYKVQYLGNQNGIHLGESLTIVTLSILNQFNEDEIFEPSIENINSTYNDQIQQALKLHVNSTFYVDESQYYSSGTSKIYGINRLNTDQQMSKNLSKLKTCMPLIYYSSKDQKEGNSPISQFSKFKIINDLMKVPLPLNRDSNQRWLVIQLSILGQLEKDNFAKNMILNVNQALQECQLEQFIKSNFQREQDTLNFKLISPYSNINEINQQNRGKNKLKINNQSIVSKNIEQLEMMLLQQKITFTSMVQDFEKLIYGDQSDIICTLVNSFIFNFHQEIRKLCSASKDQKQDFSQWNLTLIIEFLNKNTSKLEKTIIYSFGEKLMPKSYEELQNDLKLHLSKTKTLLRNIHPSFKLIVGSFKIQPHLGSNYAADNQNLIFKDFDCPQFEFDGIRPDDHLNLTLDFQNKIEHQDSSHNPAQVQDDRLSSLKIYQNITQNLNTPDIKLNLPRSFFMILSIKDQKLNFKSFNLDKSVIKKCKLIIYDQLLWNSNRQNFFKRIVSQKLGTVYTLKDYYSSTHLIKDQTLDTLYQNNRYTYDKIATIIEGKQLYDFKKVIKRQRRKSQRYGDPQQLGKEVDQSRRRNHRHGKNQKEEVKKDNNAPTILNSALSLQLQGEEFLKSLNNDDDLKNLYKKVKAKKSSLLPENTNIIKDNKQNSAKLSVEFKNSQDDQNKKMDQKPISIPFVDFIQNKVINNNAKNRSVQELKLFNMYVISPSLQPSRANIILTQIDKNNQLELMKQNPNLIQYIGERISSSVENNNKVMVVNPLFFHGMRMIKMLKCYFQRVKNSQQLALIYTKCEDLVQRKFVTSKNKTQQEQFKKLFDKISAGQSIQNQLSEVENLIQRSRLLYTNITQQLFDDTSHISIEEAAMQAPSSATIIGQSDPIQSMTQKQLEEMRRNLLTEYNNFLLQKIGVKNSVCFMFSENPGDSTPVQLLNKSSKGLNSSLHSMRIQLFDYGLYGDDEYIQTMTRSHNLNARPKKSSEDFQDSSEADKHNLLNPNGSNSSLVVSSQYQDSYYYNQILTKTRKERVLKEISEEGQDSKHTLYSYIVKTLFDDSMIIYELKYQNGLVRINVYKFDSMIKTFPRNIFSDYNIYFSDIQVRREKREMIVHEVHNLSTRLNLDSFNYDFHLKEISNQIAIKSKKQVNVSHQLYNILSYYKSPPKYSKNLLDVVTVKFDLGDMNGMKDTEFLAYFCSRHKDFGLRIFSEPSKGTNLQQVRQKYSQSVIEGQPQQPKETNEKIQYAFFKVEGLKPKIENFGENLPQSQKRTSSFIIQSSGTTSNSFIERQHNGNINHEKLEERVAEQDRLANMRNDQSNQKQPMKVNQTSQAGNTSQNEQAAKKLYYIELKNKLATDQHNDGGEQCDIYKKQWNVECKKYENTVSGTSPNESTVVEFLFYMLYTVPLYNNQVDQQGLPKDIRKNSERYPLKDVCQDMYLFIDQLDTAFSECRKELKKEKLWERFLDNQKKQLVTDTEIRDMLKFSYQYDLKQVNERYRDILALNLNNIKFNDYLRNLFGVNCHSFKNRRKQDIQQSMLDQSSPQDLLIFDPQNQTQLIHIEFNYGQRAVNAFIYKRHSRDDEVDNHGLFDTRLIKKVMNHITFWLWKSAIC